MSLLLIEKTAAEKDKNLYKYEKAEILDDLRRKNKTPIKNSAKALSLGAAGSVFAPKLTPAILAASLPLGYFSGVASGGGDKIEDILTNYPELAKKYKKSKIISALGATGGGAIGATAGALLGKKNSIKMSPDGGLSLGHIKGDGSFGKNNKIKSGAMLAPYGAMIGHAISSRIAKDNFKKIIQNENVRHKETKKK